MLYIHAEETTPKMSDAHNDTPRPPLRLIETGRAERLVNVRYEDLLRVVGYYVDEHKWHDVVLTQIPDGMLLKGVVVEATPQGNVERVTAILFTNDMIVELLNEGYRRRQPNPPTPAPE
jgi:hypothetical protein